MSPSPPSASFAALSTHLLQTARLAHAPSGPPTSQPLTASIAGLSLHPTLEATLHMLNGDLPSAHFLVRHMQAPPAVEGMLLHGILHRVEGDFGNARAWVGDVADAGEGFVPKRRDAGEKLEEGVAREVRRCGQGEGEGEGEGGENPALLSFVYGEAGVQAAMELIDDVEFFRKRKGGDAERRSLELTVREELGCVLEWCSSKFGTGEWADATSAWTKNSDEVQKMSNDMVSGGKGYREF
ncbi:hypothetical protein G6514_005249 [Epicoccum nigrum]|nr:hypothetical protein G6514_005249 [Epicoccum nigrum]